MVIKHIERSDSFFHQLPQNLATSLIPLNYAHVCLLNYGSRVQFRYCCVQCKGQRFSAGNFFREKGNPVAFGRSLGSYVKKKNVLLANSDGVQRTFLLLAFAASRSAQHEDCWKSCRSQHNRGLFSLDHWTWDRPIRYAEEDHVT